MSNVGRPIYFFRLQETLTADFARLQDTLRLPSSVVLPEDEIVSHRTPPGFETKLSSVGGTQSNGGTPTIWRSIVT